MIKKQFQKLTGIGLFLAVGTLVAVQAAEVTVNWVEPMTYSDMDRGVTYSQSLFERFSERMESHISDEADRYLPPSYSLSLTVMDVDLAGEEEFWRGVDYSDVRIIRDIYPPRMKFQYQVKNDQGEIIKEGMSQVTDLNYLWNVARSVHQTDPFFYEKELISDWMRKTLSPLAPGK